MGNDESKPQTKEARASPSSVLRSRKAEVPVAPVPIPNLVNSTTNQTRASHAHKETQTDSKEPLKPPNQLQIWTSVNTAPLRGGGLIPNLQSYRLALS